MPTANKIGWAQLKVGVLAIVALVILGVLVFLLTGTSNPFQSKVSLFTYLDDAAAMGVGAAVRLNGIPIGSVDEITLSGENTPNRQVKLRLTVEKKILTSIPIDSRAEISAENVLGTKFINIKRGRAVATIQPNQEVKSLPLRDFDEVVQTGNELLESLQGIVKRVDAIVGLVEVGKGSIGKLLVDEELYNRLNGTIAEVQQIATALTQNKGTIGRLIYDETLYNDVRGSIQHVNDLLTDIKAGKGTTGRLINDPALYNEVQQTVAELHKLVEDLNAGKGTAGKLLKSDELSDQLKLTMNKIDTTIDKVNSGQGTIGQLLVNPQLYDSLNGASGELHLLMKDFRRDPRKFLRIKLSLF